MEKNTIIKSNICRNCGKPKGEHQMKIWCVRDDIKSSVFKPATRDDVPLEKELTTWINQDGSIETKMMPKNTGFEIENYEGTFHGFKHILESCFLKINDTDSVKVKMHFQVTNMNKPKSVPDKVKR